MNEKKLKELEKNAEDARGDRRVLVDPIVVIDLIKYVRQESKMHSLYAERLRLEEKSSDTKLSDIHRLLEGLRTWSDMAKAVKEKDYIMTNNSERHYEKWKEGDWEVYDLDIALQMTHQLRTKLIKTYGEK